MCENEKESVKDIKNCVSLLSEHITIVNQEISTAVLFQGYCLKIKLHVQHLHSTEKHIKSKL